LLLSGFGFLATTLALSGMYAVISYWVAQRTKEIGVRLALGAQTKDVIFLVLSGGLKLAAMGILIGVCAGLGLTRLITSFLYGVHPLDIGTFTLVAVGMLILSIVCCYFPARSASEVEPNKALRYE